MQNKPINFDNLRRALIVKLRHHGDVLLASPVISALKQAAPHCEIDALVYTDTTPMLAGHPALAQLHLIDRDWKKLGVIGQIKAESKLLASLRARRYDLVVHLSVHRRGAWLVRLLRPRWSVAPRYKGNFWDNSFTHFYPSQSNPNRPTVESNLDSLRSLGFEPLAASKRVVMIPGIEAEAHIDTLLSANGLKPGRFIHLHPASRWLFKCWPTDKFASLCDQLAGSGWPLVLTAAPDPKETNMVKEILARRTVSPTPTLNLSGRLSLKQLAALTARARLFVGVDSAPMHIAAAMGTPTVALFGPSGDREWGPWMVENRIVTSKDHECRPCGQDGCNGSKVSACLTELPVSQVMAACRELLG